MLNYGLTLLCGLHSEAKKVRLNSRCRNRFALHVQITLGLLNSDRKASPCKSHATAGPVGVPEDPGGNDLAEGLQHVFQLLLVHGHRQVGDVEVGGVLLLLLHSKIGFYEPFESIGT